MLFLTAASAPGRDLWDAGDRRLVLRTSLKGGALLWRSPEAPEIFPERDGVSSLWRFRVEPELRLGSRMTVMGAYEHRLRLWSSSEGLAGPAVLPNEAPPPYRLRALDWPVANSSHFSWRHEVDRAAVALHLPRVELTVGRQAIGWGRGVLFSAVDLFSPFSPLEGDREWRRGVDALRADIRLTDRASADLVAALGPAFESSILAGRLRGFAGDVDIEVLGGSRARDLFGGVTTSMALGKAEAHGEVAVFRAPTALRNGSTAGRTVVKAVAGSSYRFALGSGLLVFLEYHYSGFGARRPGDVLTLLSDATFRDRFVRGDMQILGQHALAASASYEASPELALSALWLQSPVDGSGVVAPSATLTLGDKASLLATAYLPYGRRPRGVDLRSEYGGSARSVLVQVRLYD
jgi:hypothetical protein